MLFTQVLVEGVALQFLAWTHVAFSFSVGFFQAQLCSVQYRIGRLGSDAKRLSRPSHLSDRRHAPFFFSSRLICDSCLFVQRKIEGQQGRFVSFFTQKTQWVYCTVGRKWGLGAG